MSLILGKDGIQKLMVGYPTVSDKYNVGPAVNCGTSPIYPGDMVFSKDSQGHGAYVGAGEAAAGMHFVGFAVATNVNVPMTYPAPEGPVPFAPGQAFGLMQSGYIAVELASNAVLADVVEGLPLYVSTTGPKLTTNSNSGNAKKIPGYFTGVKEMHGSAIVAEIFVPFIEAEENRE